jgi:NADH-quinone oxidoreductase subunit N
MQLLPEAILVVTAIVLLGVAVATEVRKGRPVTAGLTIPIASTGIVLALLSLTVMEVHGGSGTPLILIDGMARIFKGVVLCLGLLAVLLPPAKREMANIGEFHALMLFGLTGLLLAVGTNHLLLLFVALELAGLSFYLLAGFPRTAKASEASLKYFLFGGVSAAFLLFGMSLLYGFSQSAMLTVIAAKVGANPDSGLAMAGLLMILVGLGFKLAAAPFHYWAPDVYQGAPATTVGLVSAASKAAGVVVLVRFLTVGFHSAAGSAAWGNMAAGWSVWIAVLAAVSMIFGNLLALAQKSVRRLIAYSAVANTGYLFVAMTANNGPSTAAALFYVVVYGLATFGTLAITAAVERDRGNDSRESFAGLIHRSPMQAVALLVFITSLAGIPPLAGFVGKFTLFSTALSGSATGQTPGLTWLVTLAALMSAVSLYYYLVILKQAFVADCAGEKESIPAPLPPAHLLAVGLPALALVVLGLFPSLLMNPITTAVTISLGLR